jgi:hypothetical protein
LFSRKAAVEPTMSTSPITPPFSTARVFVYAGVWLVVALVAGATGAIGGLRPLLPQLILVALTALLIVLGVKLPRYRAWLMSIDLRAVIALHLTRLVAGAAFVVLAAVRRAGRLG